MGAEVWGVSRSFSFCPSSPAWEFPILWAQRGDRVSRNLIQSYSDTNTYMYLRRPSHFALNSCPCVSLGRVPGPAHSRSSMSCACGPGHPETSFHTSRSGGQFRPPLSGPGKQFGGWGDEKLFLCPKVGPWVAPSCFFGVMGPPSPRTQPWLEEEAGMECAPAPMWMGHPGLVGPGSHLGSGSICRG